jgi:hypothetical protein
MRIAKKTVHITVAAGLCMLGLTAVSFSAVADTISHNTGFSGFDANRSY